MADFNLDEYKKKQDDYFTRIKDEQEQRSQQRLENQQRYSINLTDDQYAAFNEAIANAPNPDEEAHKIGLAISYANQLGVSIPEAYQNVDNYNEALFGKDKTTSYRNWWTVVNDALSMGHNNVQIGRIGNDLRRATKRGDTELAAALSEEIKQYQADNELKYDNAPRSWVTNVLKNGAQSLPYTAYAAGAAMFGGFIAGPVGTAAAFSASSELMAGQEYVDMIDAGYSHEVAAPASLISGGIQGLVETALGEVMSFAGAGGAALGREIGGKLTSKAIEDSAEAITKTLQTKLHFGAANKSVVKALVEYIYNLPEEGAEEWLQTVVSSDIKNIAAQKENQIREDKRTEEEKAVALDKAAETITDAVADELYKTIAAEYPELNITPASDIFKDALEDFKGGVEGAIALGFIPAAGRTLNDAVKVQKVKDMAETMPSEAAFKAEMKKERVDKDGNVFKYSDVLNAENEADLNSVLSDIWEDKSKQRAETNYASVRDIAELNTADEGYEEAETDEETGETIVAPVERNEQGELDTESVVTENEDGTSHLQYKVGTTKKEDKNLYGYIDATIDKDGNKITINKFSMDINREGLRQEVYEQFAADNPGMEIDWSPVTKHGKAVKDLLIQNNINGKNNGLSYYKNVEDLEDSKIRRSVAKEVRTNIKNIQDYEVPAAVAYMEDLAKARGMSLNTWYKQTFNGQIFGDVKEVEQKAAANGDNWNEQAGATDWKVIGNEVKAIIYAGENADFSTFVHEVTHAWQGELTRAAAKGDQQAQQLQDKLEKAFNVQNHDWRHSQFTFKNGEVNTSDEALAYGMQDFLKSGTAENKDLLETFKQLGQFIANCLNSLANFIELTPEIKEAYNAMIQGDDTALAKAYRDAQKAEREIRQQEKQTANEQQKAKQEAAENKAKETEETNFKAPEEQSEETEEIPEENIPKPEEIAAEIEKQNETTMDATTEDILNNVQEANTQDQINSEITDAITDAVGEDGIDQDVIDALLSDVTTLEEKQQSITDIADEAQDQADDDIYDGPIFQKNVSWDELYEAAIPALDVYPKVEKDRIVSELNKNKDTPWYRSAIQGLLVRRDIQEIMGKDEIDLSKLHSMLDVVNEPINGKGEETLHKVAMGYINCIKDGKRSIETYLAKAGIIGAADKAVTAINSSTVNCHPSPECAKYCYASAGNYLYLPSTVKSELVTWYIEHYPQDAAKLTIRQFMGMPDWHINRALRLFDKGDISQEWIPYIQALNAKGIYCQIFSKNAELLHKLDPNKNILMFSVDYSNYEECLKNENLDLPLAFVYRGEQDLQYIEANKARFEEHGGVILPVKQGQKVLSKEEVDKLPQWAKRYTCPIDAGWKVLKYPQGATIEDIEKLGNLWHCTNCNKDGGGVGCFAGRTVAELRQIKDNILDFTGEELNERITNITNTLTEAAKYAEQRGSLSDNMLQLFRNLADISNKILAGYDPEATNGSSSRFNQSSSGKSGVDATGNTNSDGPQYQRTNTEIAAVRAQYENTDKWLKAPNGQDTNLTENQWLQVRTPSFKKWFGDWENDPEHASKVIDPNGEPYVVYHGTRHAGFSVFEDYENNKYKFSNAPVGSYWFAGDRHQAASYSGTYDDVKEYGEDSETYGEPGNYPVFLNIRTPERYDFEGATWNGDTYNKYKLWDLTNTDQWENPVYTKEGYQFFNSREEAEDYAAEIGLEKYEIEENPWLGMSTNEVVDEAMKGYQGDDVDGVIIEHVSDEGPEDFFDTGDDIDFIVFNSNQIKSAIDNNGNFDVNNLDIRFQTAYHGSAADFEKFDVAKYGLSGEGSMSFGYGTYLSGSEKVARDYANRQTEQKLTIGLANDVWDLITNKEIPFETVKKVGLEHYGQYEQYKDTNPTRYHYMKARYDFYNKINSIEDVQDALTADEGKRNLYEVEIPDNGYIKWDEDVNPKFANDIKDKLFKKLTTEPNEDGDYIYKGAEQDLKLELNDVFNAEMNGEMLYNNIAVYLGGEDKASRFLYENGINGIDYPAGTNFGNVDDGVRNYVIFNDLDAQIINHLQYQRRAEENANAPQLIQPHFGKDNTEEQQDAAWDLLDQNIETMDSFYSNLMNDEAFKGLHVVYDNGEQELFVHENTKADKNENKWQISYFDKFGPWSDSHVNSVEEAVRRLPKYVQFVGVMWDDVKKYDKPYYTNLDQNNYEGAQKILEEYAAKRGIAGPWETVVTDATDVTIPPSMRIENNWKTQQDFWQSGNEYSLQFQTQEELYADAMQFDNWKDFMESYTMDFNPEAMEDPMYHNQVPEAADAQWYQTVWELAHKIIPEESKNNTELAEKYEKEGPIPNVLDAMFDTDMETKPGMLENFLLKIYELRHIDFNAPDFLNPADEEEANYFTKLQELQDFLNTRLSNVTFITQSKHYYDTGDIDPSTRQRMITLIREDTREYRALYSEIMEDPQFAVEPEDLPRKYLEKKLRKYRLVSPNADLDRKSIDEISRLSKELQNREIADKIARKTLKMDDELNNYVKSLNKQIDDLQKDYDNLEKETAGDYQRIASDEKRKLLKLWEKLSKLKIEVPNANDKLQRLVEKGLKISGKYKQNVQNYKADYDEIFRKYQDLYSTVEITKEVEAALQRIQDKILIKDQLKNKQREKDVADNLKHLRVQLVKRTLRRVPFERIDYENARTIIAIQRMLEPNLLGGVNRWIGTEGPVLREVIAGILTDDDYKKDILKYLDTHSKSSQAFVDFKQLLLNTKTMADFNKWTEKQREAAIRYLPKENWIKDLNLNQLAKEREESIDLPIEMVAKKRPMKDENGNIVEKKDGTPYMATTFELDVDPEIQRLVKDAVGEKMYYTIVSRPFAEWTLEEMEELAVRINQLYTEGRDLLEAKKVMKQQEAAQIRQKIEDAVKNTGIAINDDDTPEEKKRKQEKIDKILGLSASLHGTNADKKSETRINRLLHSYNDATVLRVARILDNYTDGENVNELYRKENDCYNAKQRSINSRAENIQKLMKDNNITEELLSKEINVHDAVYNNDFTFTVDELLYILAANEDYADDDAKLSKGEVPGSIDANDDSAPTSRNAVMFGNMFASTKDLQEKEDYMLQDKQMQALIESEDPATMQALAAGVLDRTPGTTTYKAKCKGRFLAAITAAKNVMQEYPGLQKLSEAIADDYAKQYERMNEVSIAELNSPVHRVKCYVPLVRLESNGDTNENQVKEDLLGTSGVGKEWVNKGMTQRRVSIAPLNQKPVQMGLHKTWANSVERTEHFISYAAYVRELNRVYKSRDAAYTRNFIESRYGKGMMDYINSYINEVANPNANRVRTAGDELIRTLRGKTAPAYLAWKASAIIKQGATSPWPYMQFVNPAEYLAASWKLNTSHGKLYDAIREKSVFMKNRVMDPMNDLIEELAASSKGNKFTQTLNKVNSKGMAGLEWIDWICVAPGWYACYLKKFNELNGTNQDVYEATKLRLEEENAAVDVASSQWKSKDKIEALAMQAMKDDVEKRAVDYADDCTRQCQPSSRSADIAPLFKNSSEAMKAYLQFQTSLNVIWNNLRYDSVYAVKNKQFFRMGSCIIGYVAAGIMMNAIMSGWPHGDDDEPEDVLKQFIWYSTTQFTDSVPMIGSALTTASQKLITGKSDYFGANGTDMTPMVTKFINAATSAGTAIRNKDDEEKAKQAWLKAAQNFADGVNMNIGLPVSGVKEIGKLAGVGNKQPGLDLDLGSVYGIVDNITGEEK